MGLCRDNHQLVILCSIVNQDIILRKEKRGYMRVYFSHISTSHSKFGRIGQLVTLFAFAAFFCIYASIELIVYLNEPVKLDSSNIETCRRSSRYVCMDAEIIGKVEVPSTDIYKHYYYLAKINDYGSSEGSIICISTWSERYLFFNEQIKISGETIHVEGEIGVNEYRDNAIERLKSLGYSSGIIDSELSYYSFRDCANNPRVVIPIVLYILGVPLLLAGILFSIRESRRG